MVSVYLSNTTLVAAVGSGTSKKPRLRRLFQGDDLAECIVGGIVTDADAFVRALKTVWEAEKLPKSGLVLSIDSAQFITRLVEAPQMSEAKTLSYIRMDLAAVERAADPVYSWACLEKNPQTGMRRLFVTMAESSFLKTYLDLFHAAGLRVAAISPAIWGAIRLLCRCPDLQGTAGLIQLADDMNVTSLLFSHGSYAYSTKKRMFNEPESDSYGQEFAQNVSNTLQFIRGQYPDANLTRLYVAGMASVEQVEPFVEPLGVEAKKPDLSALLHGAEDKAGYESICAAGGLMKNYPGMPLLKQYHALNPKKRKLGKLAAKLIPLVVVILLLGALTCKLYFDRRTAQARLDDLNAYLSGQQTLDDLARYDQLITQISAVSARRAGYETAASGLDAYPQVDSSVNRVVESCAAGLAEININSYSAASGVLQFEAVTDAAENVTLFIDLLNRQEIFESVSYSGYSYQDNDQTWSIHVVCSLAAREVEAP